MTITALQQLFAIYYEGIGKLIPDYHPLRVLTVLDICRKYPATREELIERSGISQSSIFKLVEKLGKKGLVQPVGPDKRFGQPFAITEDGSSQLSAMEESLDIVLSAIRKTPSLPNNADGATRSETSQKQGSAAPDALEPGTTEIYKAYSKLYSGRVKDFDDRRLDLKVRRQSFETNKTRIESSAA